MTRLPLLRGALLGAALFSALAHAQPAANGAGQARARATAPAAPPPGARELAPVDLTGYWTAVVTEDWAWRMRTPQKGDFASVPLNAEGTRVAGTWTESQDGSCSAFGAPALLRMPTRVHVTWADDDTLKLETDNGGQTRLLHFEPAAERAGAAARAAANVAPGTTAGVNLGSGSAAAGAAQATPRPPSPWTSRPAPAEAPARSLQGYSRAEWKTSNIVRASGADGGVVNTRLDESRWAPLEVVTRNLSAAWLRPNGVPYSENALLTEYFDWYSDGADAWFTVTTIVDDPAYLTEPFVISSNFKREASGAKWKPAPCKG